MNPAGLVEIETCQICGSNRHRTKFVEPPWSVRQCTDCGLVFVSPRLSQEDLPKVYSERYWKSDSPKQHGYADYAKDEPLYLKTFRRRRKLLPGAQGQTLRILDVGCAAGFFLRVMHEEGHEVYGVEPSASIAAFARRHLDPARVHVGTLDDLPDGHPAAEPASFDLITLWDVVEHVPDPQALLRRLRVLLRPSGTLVLETQNVASRFAGLLGRRWHHYKHQEHLYHFDPATVRRLLEQTGFSVARNTASGSGKYVSLAFIAERAARLHPVLSWCLKPLSWFKGANVYVNFRDEMIVLARPVPIAAQAPAVAASLR